MEHENSALVRSDYDKLPREAKKTNDSTFDRIYKYYHNDKTRIELSPEEHKIRERLEKAWMLSARHRTRKQVADIIEKVFKVSRSVAYDDVRNSMMLFGDPQPGMKDAKRAIAEEMALKAMDRCWKDNDMDGYHKLLKIYVDLNQLNAEDGNGVADLLKKLKPQQIILVADPDDLMEKARKIQDDLTHDIEFEEAK